MSKLTKIVAREILDSRGQPTVEVDLWLASGAHGRAAAPAGASTGTHEALELRDADPHRYGGQGVTKALKHIREIITPAVTASDWTQANLDEKLLALDGTTGKTRLGANALLPVSLAFAVAQAMEATQPLYQYLQSLSGHPRPKLPMPMFNILNGGRHAPGGTDIQEFMVVPIGAPNYREALRYGEEIYAHLKRMIAKLGLPTTVGDEGGLVYRPINQHEQNHNENAIKLIVEAIRAAGYQPGADVAIALDVAASEFYHQDHYFLQSENQHLASEELIARYQDWSQRYPLLGVEDGLAEDDWPGWRELTKALGDKLKLVGDDLFVTNPTRLARGIAEQVANTILIKPNQIGTLSETLAVIKQAKAAAYGVIISHRSGETEDTFIADLAVGTSASFIKAGAPVRGERTAKYNQLLRLAEEIEK